MNIEVSRDMGFVIFNPDNGETFRKALDKISASLRGPVDQSTENVLFVHF